MEAIGEGATSVIRQSEYAGYVEKRYKRSNDRHLAVTEKAIHARIASLLEMAKSPLRTPKLLDLYGTHYIMEEVNTERPLWNPDVWSSLGPELQANLLDVLKGSFKLLWEERYHMRDVEVYLQPDNTLVVLDFGQVKYSCDASDTFRLQSAAVVPASITESFIN